MKILSVSVTWLREQVGQNCVCERGKLSPRGVVVFSFVCLLVFSLGWAFFSFVLLLKYLFLRKNMGGGGGNRKEAWNIFVQTRSSVSSMPSDMVVANGHSL